MGQFPIFSLFRSKKQTNQVLLWLGQKCYEHSSHCVWNKRWGQNDLFRFTKEYLPCLMQNTLKSLINEHAQLAFLKTFTTILSIFQVTNEKNLHYTRNFSFNKWKKSSLLTHLFWSACLLGSRVLFLVWKIWANLRVSFN